VKDLAGNALAANMTWSLTIAPDITPPTVTSTSPASGATNISRNANITATFSEAMDATTINITTVELRDPSGNLIPAAITYSATNRRATLNPTPTLAALTTYTATVKGGTTDPRVKDAAGNALAVSRSWSFTTR
jgi:methionine-rich copper-binding protein CopC